MSCCGKVICSGCVYAPVYDDKGNVLAENCPFCRTPMPASDEELVERVKKQMETGDAAAIYNIGDYYRDGRKGVPQDIDKALELYHRAAELGYATACCKIGYLYQSGKDVEIDKKKAKHYWELAAMRGDVMARHNLGQMEKDAGNVDRAIKHFMIAVKGGFSESLRSMKLLYSNGYATKDDFTEALRSYQAYLNEVKSAQRDKAAAVHDSYKYIG